MPEFIIHTSDAEAELLRKTAFYQGQDPAEFIRHAAVDVGHGILSELNLNPQVYDDLRLEATDDWKPEGWDDEPPTPPSPLAA